VAQSLRRGLLRYGFTVEWVPTGREALTAAAELDGTDPYDVVLLDLGLPIIVISARSDEADRVVGLELGADDYVTKPFGMREVIARIRAVLRRAQPAGPQGLVPGGAGAGTVPSGPDRYGPRLTIDRRAGRVHLDGSPVALTPKEYDLLGFLTEEPGALMSREQIMEAVWDAHWFGPTKTLDVHISWLRKKIEDEPSSPRYISTVRGVGFRFASPE